MHYAINTPSSLASLCFIECMTSELRIIYFQGIGTMCVEMYDILLPVIKFSTDVSKAPHVYLMEDGLDLWLATLHCSPNITPGLLDLFVNMPDLYGWLYLRLVSIKTVDNDAETILTTGCLTICRTI